MITLSCKGKQLPQLKGKAHHSLFHTPHLLRNEG
jgi:hypothetical protein